MLNLALLLGMSPLQAAPAAEARPDEAPAAPRSAPALPDLRQRMADPTWFSRPPSTPWWSLDGRRLYFERPVAGGGEPELFQFDLASGDARAVADAELPGVAPRRPVWDAEHCRAVFARGGDLYLHADGARRQLTRSVVAERNPRFSSDGRGVLFESGEGRFMLRLDDGFIEELPRFDLEEEEEDDEPDGHLEEAQARLMAVLSERRARREAEAERDDARRVLDPGRVPPTLHLGDQLELDGLETVRVLDSGTLECSMVLVAKPADDPQRDAMPAFVTDTSYVESSDVRPHVGVGERRAQRLLWIDWKARTALDVDLSGLPGITEDPLEERRAVAEQRAQAQGDEESEEATADAGPEAAEDGSPEDADESEADPEPRGVRVTAHGWSDDGSRLALSLRSLDNKDRWLVLLDAGGAKPVCVEHLHDPAWIGWRFHDFDWLDDGTGLWFTSEASGWSQLYVHELESGATRALTTGEFELSDVRELRGQRAFLARANLDDPGIHELVRVALEDGALARVTDLGGRSDGVLSPDQSQLAVRSSRMLAPDELFLQPLAEPTPARQLTFSTTPAFEAVPWIEPRRVTVPARHGRPIHARLYLPPELPPELPSELSSELSPGLHPQRAADASAGGRPAVVFVHGAGYLQNAHAGWSGYFREFFFHDLLARSGVVVLDMDYRASAGYGRDWRTAIHLVMGEPELEDFEDGVAYLTAEHGVDPARIGIYGGSYGGFMTLMALFKRPGLFAAGAALRPVTDWAHYNDGYTRNILETPELAPEAYRDSSPIEWAAGLADALLICHGMLDDNVLAKDSIRLAQRLIELEKDDWELALYPLEPHGFREPSSWRDEYTRILTLFERELGFRAIDR